MHDAGDLLDEAWDELGVGPRFDLAGEFDFAVVYVDVRRRPRPSGLPQA